MAKFKPPEISWTAQDLHQEWRRFSRQAECIFHGPLPEKEESVKVSYLKLWVGNKRVGYIRRIHIRKARRCSETKGRIEEIRRILRATKKPHNGCFEI